MGYIFWPKARCIGIAPPLICNSAIYSFFTFYSNIHYINNPKKRAPGNTTLANKAIFRSIRKDMENNKKHFTSSYAVKNGNFLLNFVTDGQMKLQEVEGKVNQITALNNLQESLYAFA